jgi:hypothetical protein
MATLGANICSAIAGADGSGYGCKVLLTAAAHQGAEDVPIVLVLTTDGRLCVVSAASGKRGAASLCCGAHTKLYQEAVTRAHVDHITAVDIQALQEGGARCARVTISLDTAQRITAVLTTAAVGDLVLHMQSLRALSRGLPAAGGPALPLTSNVRSDAIQRVQSNPPSPPVLGSMAAGLLSRGRWTSGAIKCPPPSARAQSQLRPV